MPENIKVLVCKNAVDAYRIAHTNLYKKDWHKGIPEEHTPLLNAMLTVFKTQGFNSIQEFFDASELENIKELGFVDKADFEANAKEADIETLDRMWH